MKGKGPRQAEEAEDERQFKEDVMHVTEGQVRPLSSALAKQTYCFRLTAVTSRKHLLLVLQRFLALEVTSYV